LLTGRTISGITVQTLHPKHFDHGLILAQTPFEVPKNGSCTHTELVDHVKPLAADLLLQTLQRGLFREPASIVVDSSHIIPSRAPKLTREVARVDWQTWPAERILRTQRANEPLWNFANDLLGVSDVTHTAKDLRIQWHGLKHESGYVSSYSKQPDSGSIEIQKPQQLVVTKEVHEERTVSSQPLAGIWTCDNVFLSAKSITIAGRPKHQEAATAIHYLEKVLRQA